jgi:hypothetical protein
MIARPDLIMQVPISQIEPLFALDAVRVDRYIAMLKDGKTPPPIWIRTAPRVAHPFRWRLCDGSHRLRAATLAGRKMILCRIQ